MHRIADFIIKNKKWVFIITCILVLASIVGTVFTVIGGKINSNMLEYLPEQSKSAEGIAFLKENFAVEGDAFVVVEGCEGDTELAASVSKMKKNIKGISQFVWYNDIVSIENLLELTPSLRDSMNLSTSELKNYLRQPNFNGQGQIISYNYVLLILFNYSPSTFEAFNVHKQIRTELQENLNRAVAISGMTALADTVMSQTMKEIPFYFIFSVIAVMIILLLATDSFVDPIVLIITMAVSILINMGTNYFFKDISIISFAASGIIQLGLTMDYAIFLLHAYKEDRLLFSPAEAAKKALPRTIISVVASGLTTAGGFAALYFMQFKVGADLANIIIKGVFMSLITVLVLQPCLMVVFDKANKRTEHKKLNLNFSKIVSGTLKARHIIAIVAILLVVPAFIGQDNVKFSYLKIFQEQEETTSQQILAEKLANQIIIAVPLKPSQGSHKEFIDSLYEEEKISNVLGAYTFLDMEIEDLKNIISNPLFAKLPAMKMLFSEVEDNYYTLYLATIEGDTEDEAAFLTYHSLMDKLNYYFDESYPLGMLTGVGDMANVTPGDFLRVTLISAAIIFLIMAILLKSALKSAIMVVLIELAIWINISINTLLGIPINFMIYIIISSVQLGCMVDYAILLTTRFSEALNKYEDTHTAIKKAASSAFPSIATSAAIIMGACTSVYFVTANLLVKEMAMMLIRGAFISFVLVIVVLPCLLVYFKKKKYKEKGKNKTGGILGVK